MSEFEGKHDQSKSTQFKPSQESITLTKADLQQLLAQAVGGAVEAANSRSSAAFSDGMKELAAAILKSREPYVDPRQLENDQAMRESMRVVTARMKAQIIASQETCPHMQGCNELSDFAGQLSSFVLHRLDNGVVLGICTNCQLQIFSDDPNPAVRKLFQMKSGNRMSSAGIRTFRDPLKAMSAGRLPPLAKPVEAA